MQLRTMVVNIKKLFHENYNTTTVHEENIPENQPIFLKVHVVPVVVL